MTREKKRKISDSEEKGVEGVGSAVTTICLYLPYDLHLYL